MPGPTVKEVLLKFGIDASNWKSAILELGKILEQQQKSAASAQANAKKSLAEQRAVIQEIVLGRKAELEALQKSAALSRAAAAAEGAKAATAKAAAAGLAEQAAQQRLLTESQRTAAAAVAAKISQERLVTAEIARQTAQLRQQAVVQRASGGGGGGRGGAGGGAIGGFVGGFASRLAGTIGFAVLSAEGLGRVMEMLTIKVKNFIEGSGPLQQVREQFEKLAAIKGYDAVAFLTQMRAATHNLIGDTLLYRTANLAMQSGLNISQKQIVDLTQATVGLARGQGKTATEAVNALNRAFLTGRAMTLSYVTGLQRTQLQLTGVGKATDQLTQRQAQFDKINAAIIQRFHELGEPAITFTERLTEVKTIWDRLGESFARGVATSSGTKTFMEDLAKTMEKIGGKEGAVEKLGASLGSVFAALGQWVQAGISAFKALGSVIQAYAKVYSDIFGAVGLSGLSEWTAQFSTIQGAMTSLGEAAILAGSGFAQFAAIVDNFTKHPGLTLMRWVTEFSNKMQHAATYSLELATGLPQGALGDLNKPSDYMKDVVNQATGGADLDKQLQGISDKTAESLADFEFKSKHPGYQPDKGPAGGGGAVPAEQTQQQKQQLLQATLAMQKASNKERLDDTKLSIQEDKDANEQAYADGTRSFAAYMAAKRDIERRDHEAKLLEIKQNTQDQVEEQTKMLALQTKAQHTELSSIKVRLADPKVSPEERQNLENQQAQIQSAVSFQEQLQKLKIAAAEDSGKAQAAAENRGYDRQKEADAKEEVQMSKQTRQELAAAILGTDKARIEQSKSLLEDELKSGNVSVESYLATRVKLTQNMYANEQAEADLWLTSQKDNTKTNAQYLKKNADAAEKMQKDLTDLSIKEDDIRTKHVTDSYDRAQKVLEGQLKFAQQGAGFSGTGESQKEQIPILNALIDLEMKRLKITTDQLSQQSMVNSETGALNDTWVKLTEDQNKSLEVITSYRKQLVAAEETSKVMVGTLSDFSQGLASLSTAFSGKGQAWMKEFSKDFADMAKKQEEFSKTTSSLRELQAGRKTGAAATVSPQAVMAATVESVRGGGEGLKTALQTSSNELYRWTAALAAAISRLTPGAATPAPTSGVSGAATAAAPGGTLTASDLGSSNIAALSTDVGADSTSANAASSMQQLGAAAALAVPPLAALAPAAAGAKDALGSKGGSSNDISSIMSGFSDSVKDGKFNIGEFSKALSAAMQVVSNAAQMVTGQGGPMASGMAGASVGSEIGGMLPIPGGQLIGAAIGGIIGIFTGEARKKTDQLAKSIEASFNAVMTEISAGTMTLGAGITTQASTIREAVQSLSGQKGGSADLQQILPQMEQQLQQLQQQQEQVTSSFDKQLSILNAPAAYQQTISSINQIIQTYQQYVQAGGNVANANQFLQQSFQQLVQQGLQSLNSSEQDAINNALQYNDLLLQQQQLANNTAMQIQQIMSGGVSQRQMPEWMAKAAQLQDLQQNSQIQMDQLNEEIAVSQHKLQNEQQIFDLATTRVGLESQLIILQNSQTDLQTQQVQALEATVAAFQAGIPTNMGTALTQLGLGSAYTPWTGEATAKPTPPIPTGIATVDQTNEAIYQQALAYYNQQAGLSTSATIQPGGTNSTTVASGEGLTLGATPYPSSGLLPGASPVGGVPVGTTAAGGTTAASSALSFSLTQQAQVSQQSLSTEQQITTMVNARVSAETTLVNLKMQEIAADTARMTAWQNFLGAKGSGGSSMPTIEDLLQTTYQNRGRQGFSGFYGETSNPT